MTDLARPPEVIRVAHQMDSKRRELFVEGTRDRSFFAAALPTGSKNHTLIRVINESVDMTWTEPNNRRGQVVEFAKLFPASLKSLRCVVDSDDKDLNALPKNVWATDRRDLEGYLWTERGFGRLVNHGLNRDDTPLVKSLLNSISVNANSMAGLRKASDTHELKLPFADVNLQKYLSTSKDNVKLDVEALVKVLMQKARRTEPTVSKLIAEADAHSIALRQGEDPFKVIHGKDAIAIACKAIKPFTTLKLEDIETMIWLSFDSSIVSEFRILKRVYKFVQGSH